MIPRARLLAQLAADIQRDAAAYRQLRRDLQALHATLLSCAGAATAAACAALDAQLPALAQRARRRGQVLQALGSAGGSEAVVRVLGELPAAVGSPLQTLWQALERDVDDCRRLNERNGLLLRSQSERVQELLGGAAGPGIYTPGT